MKAALFLAFCMFTFVNGTVITDLEKWVKESDINIFNPKKYEPAYNETYIQEKWSLTTYTKIAEDIVKMFHHSKSFLDLLKDYIKATFTEQETAKTQNQVTDEFIRFEIPYFIMAAIPLVLMFILPIIGCVFCRRQSKRDRKNKLSEVKVIGKRKTRRFLSASFVLTAATFILIAGIACFLASERLDSGIELGKTMLINSMNNIAMFANKTASTLHVLLGDDFDIATNMTTKALDTLPERLAVEIIHGINLVTEPYFNSVLQLDKIVNDNLDYFNTMESNRTHILTLIPNATTLIENIQTNLTKLYEDMCVDKSVSYCQVLNVKNMKITENFTQIVDLSNTTSRLSGLYEDQLEKKVNQSRMKIATISDVIVKSRNDTASSVKNMTKEIKEFKEKMLNSVDATKDMVHNMISPMKQKLQSIRSDASFNKIELIISIILKLPCLCIILMCGLLYGGLAIGEFGTAHTFIWEIDEFSPSMKMARTGKDLILSFIYLFLMVCIFLLLLLSMTTLLGANMTHFCTTLKDNTLIEKVIDDNETWSGFPLSKMLQHEAGVELKVSEILLKCGKGESIWQVLQLEKLINTTGISNIRETFPSIDSTADMSNIKSANYLPNITDKLSSEDLNLIHFNTSNITATNKFVSFSIDDIKNGLTNFQMATPNPENLTDMYEPTSIPGPVVIFDMRMNHLICEVIGTIADNFHTGDAAFSYQILTQLILLDGTYLQEMMKSFKFINETERKVHEAMENMFLVTEKLEKRTVEMQNFFENGFDKLINQTLLIQQDGILRVMVRYGSYVMKELTTNMGMCNIFPETYDNMKGLLCFYLADSVNAIWLSLAIVVFSFIFFSPMYMDLITHYRIAALDFESENGPLTTEASDLKFSIGAARQVSERAENQWM